MVFSQELNKHRILKRLAKALIRLCVCAGWFKALLVAHTTLLEIACTGSNYKVWTFITPTYRQVKVHFVLLTAIAPIFIQADLRHCWSHIPHCWKSHALGQIKSMNFYHTYIPSSKGSFCSLNCDCTHVYSKWFPPVYKHILKIS